jgi:hypothetical protein
MEVQMPRKRAVKAKHPIVSSIVKSRIELPARAKALQRLRKGGAASKECSDGCALHAWQSFRSVHLTPSYNWMINFATPPGKLLVIELVTATIEVPVGEAARLRMYTSLAAAPGNFDLFLTPQGVRNGDTAIWVCTQSVRAYTDNLLEFDVNRDNSWTEGHALVCVSGYLVTP